MLLVVFTFIYTHISYRVCTEEDVSCFRRRVATLFELGNVYAEHATNLVQKVIKLMYKGVLSDGVKLAETNVRNNATVTLMVSGGYKVTEVVGGNVRDSDFSDLIITNKVQRYAEAGVQVKSLKFPSSLSAGQRALVHETCEKLGLLHVSSGEAGDRFITVSHQSRLNSEVVDVVDKDVGGSVGSSGGGSSRGISSGGSSGSGTSDIKSSPKATTNQKPGGALDLKALHFERMNRNKKDTKPSVPAVSTPALDEWSDTTPSNKPTGQKKTKKKKNNAKKATNNTASTSTSVSGGACQPDVDDDDMLLLDNLIQSQKEDKETKVEVSKSDPGYGWKRWVDSEGVLQSNVSHEEERKSSVLKISMKSKITEKQSERSTKPSTKKK